MASRPATHNRAVLTAETHRVQQEFQRALKRYLEDSGESPAELAFRAGILESTLSCYINRPRAPRVAHLALLARATELSVDELIGVWEVPETLNEEPLTEEDVILLAAVAAMNDAGDVPTYSAVAQLAGKPKQRTRLQLRRLAAAGWCKIAQDRQRKPGAIQVTAKYAAQFEEA